MYHSFFMSYVITIIALICVDVPWIMFVAKKFYVKQIGHLMAHSPSYAPALLFYCFYAAALLFFVIGPTQFFAPVFKNAFIRGAFFGFIVYSAYNLTNQATLKDWAWTMTIVDVTWGTVMTGTVSGIVALLI